MVPENLEHGDYVYSSVETSGHLDDLVIAVASTAGPTGEDVTGDMLGGIYTGVGYQFFATNQDGVTLLNNYITTLTEANKAEAIVSICMFPASFQNAPMNAPRFFDLSYTKNTSSIDGYVPKNKKLFTHPYNFLYVFASSGASAEMPYEYFSGSSCTFRMLGDISSNPNIVLYPTNYKGMANNYNEKMVVEGFPQCAYNIDSYKAWLAQNGTSTVFSVLSTALPTAMALTNPATFLGGLVGAANIGSKLAQVSAQQARPPQASGAQGTSVQVAAKMLDFYFAKASIRAEFARIIDEYFSMFGYATHRVKLPNIRGRQSWNYVKTINCNITGSVPFGDIVRIKQMFNDGVTFWHGDYVGDYSRSNNIITA